MNKIFDLKSKMNYELPESLNLSTGTSLKGYIECSYAELVANLGEPNQDDDGNKVDAQWLISTLNGVATIYNYKDGINYLGEEEGTKVEEIVDWHVGGNREEVVEDIKSYLGLGKQKEKGQEEDKDSEEEDNG